MKSTILSLLFAFTISFTAFGQKANSKKPAFEVISSDHITVSKDSITTTLTGNVDIKGNNFHFSKADKVVYNRNENILLIYNCAKIEVANAISVATDADGKKYIRYKL